MNPNRLVRLKSRPRGMATRENFIIDTEPVPPLRDGEIEIDTKFVSLDPATRGWMSEGKSYVAPVALASTSTSRTWAERSSMPCWRE
jgi:NADPH-dependent curcumin reductase CurA